MSEKCSRLRVYLQIFIVTMKQIPTDTSLTASTNVISMQYPNTILNTKMTLPQLLGPIDVVSPEHSSGDRSHEFQIASSKNVSIEFSKAEYARPTKAELAHCTTSSRSSKYAQSQKLSSFTSQKYRIFPHIGTSIVALRLTCARLHFHVSGASKRPVMLVLAIPVGLSSVQSRSLYGRHVSTSFLDPVFGAMMKQACRQTLKSLAAECLVGVRLGLLNFLTPVCTD